MNSNDPVFFIATDAGGKRVATYCGTDGNPKERFVYHAGGAGGPGFSGGVLMRTRASTESTPTNWATQAGSAIHAERFTYATDVRGNVAAIVKDSGRNSNNAADEKPPHLRPPKSLRSGVDAYWCGLRWTGGGRSHKPAAAR